jgi:hypothetical protein
MTAKAATAAKKTENAAAAAKKTEEQLLARISALYAKLDDVREQKEEQEAKVTVPHRVTTAMSSYLLYIKKTFAYPAPFVHFPF